MDSTQTPKTEADQATAEQAFSELAGWIFHEVREAHESRGADLEAAEDEAERIASITPADAAERYLAGAAIVRVWQLDHDDATEVRRILNI